MSNRHLNPDDLANIGYEYTLTPDTGDAILVQFPGVPELHTVVHREEQAHAMAAEVVGFWIERGTPIVPPVQVQPGKHYVTLAELEEQHRQAVPKVVIPVGAIKSFGPGPKYEVGQAIRKLDDGDWLVAITLIETGEQTEYRLSSLLDDPEAQ